MQIQYNITRLEEWCKSNDLGEGTLSMESLMQATKLLQLKKVSTHHILRDAGRALLNTTRLSGYTRRYRHSLRCLLDLVSYTDPKAHQPIPRR